jgi:acid stress-induced BolA-like protein IbaG/YrbA
MVTCDDVKHTIEKHLPGSKVSVTNPRGDDVHFAVEVEWEGFKELSLVEQHKKVYECFNNSLNSCGMPLHALQIKTTTSRK